MSELCLSSTSKTKFSSLLISVFIFFSSFILSHPLHFLCLIIFSPFLLKALSFLSPLFITTSLLLIALLTISPGLVKDKISTEESTKMKVSLVSFLLTAYHAAVQKLQPKVGDYDREDIFHSLETLDVYKTVFETSMIDETGKEIDGFEAHPEEKILQAVESSVTKITNHDDGGGSVITTVREAQENSDKNDKVESIKSVILQEKMFEDFFDGLDEFESVKGKEVEHCRRQNLQLRPSGTIIDKVVDRQKEKSIVMNGSEATTGNKICDEATVMVRNDVENRREYALRTTKAHSEKWSAKSNGGEYKSRDGNSRSVEYDLRSYGSMRKEKEWKRTLACKLFEERHNHNVDGGEGMDLLWETYEMESSKVNKRAEMKKKNSSKSQGKIEYLLNDDDDEAEDEVDGQLCCLQAFKLSAGKMNMGVGRRNLARLSKAVKGFGWLHHVTKQRK